MTEAEAATTRAELLGMVDRMTIENKKILLAFLRALESGDREALEAMEAARAENDAGKLKAFCERYRTAEE